MTPAGLRFQITSIHENSNPIYSQEGNHDLRESTYKLYITWAYTEEDTLTPKNHIIYNVS